MKQKKEKILRVRVFEKELVKSLGKKIKHLRKNAKITQRQLSFESGITLSQITRIETGKLNPTISTLYRISKTLEVEMADLFK